jgi:glycerol-3-phosphate O-acyltransferase
MIDEAMKQTDPQPIQTQATPRPTPSRLPAHMGVLRAFLLRWLFADIHLSREQLQAIQQLPPGALVVFVTQQKSRLDWLFAYTRYPREGLAPCRMAFDQRLWLWQPMGYLLGMFRQLLKALFRQYRWPDIYRDGTLDQVLSQYGAVMVGLLEKRGLRRWLVKPQTDPLSYLITHRHEIQRPLWIVSQMIYFSSKPPQSDPGWIDTLFGPAHRPRRLRRLWTLIRRPSRVFVELLEPVDVDRFCQQDNVSEKPVEQQAAELRRHLLARMDRHQQGIIGPVLKSGIQLKQSILFSARLQRFIRRHARRRGIPVAKANAEAISYLDEIAAQYTPAVVRIVAWLAKQLINRRFDGVSVKPGGLEQLRKATHRGPLIFIPCHKSNLDSMTLALALHLNKMISPHFFAGRNLAFWPAGPILRRVGGFFVRRTFKGAVFYVMVFAEYIHRLLQEGFNIAVFIEGGRSRTGRLLTPQLGMLNILINAWKNEACRDMSFVPVYIGYDRVPEEGSYLKEMRGSEKAPESLKQVISARRLLKFRYGKIYIRFAEPIPLAQRISRLGLPGRRMSSRQQNQLCQDLGEEALAMIVRKTVVTPQTLVATAILSTGHQRMAMEELTFLVETLTVYLLSRGMELAETLMLDSARSLELALEDFCKRRFIRCLPIDPVGQPGKRQYKIIGGKRPALEYYKNSVLAVFLPAALTSLALLDQDVFQFSSDRLIAPYRHLATLLENEFIDDPDFPPEVAVRKTIKAFIDDAMLVPHPSVPDTYRVTALGFKKLKLFAGMLKSLLESYYITLLFLKELEKETLHGKELGKKIRVRGIKMFKNGQVDRIESLSVPGFLSAWDHFNRQGIKSRQNHDAIEAAEKSLTRYLSRLA